MTPPNQVSRRGFLLAITGSAIAAAAGCRPDNVIPPTIYAPGTGPRATHTPAPTVINQATAAPDANWGSLTYDKTVTTPVDQLYITQYNYGITPEVDAKEWVLVVDGLVENMQRFDLDMCKAFPEIVEMRTLECISNPPGGDLIGNLKLKGFDFKNILDKVKVKPTATHARFEAADGYETSVALEWLTQPNVMLAYEMNDEPLNTVHGFPLRIMIPGLYGQKMPRWITRIEFIDYEFTGFWESKGWSRVASIQTTSILRSPTNNAEAQTGTAVVLQGIAFAGKRAVTSVDVQIDNGEWMPATLVPAENSNSWTQWYVNWTIPAPGTYRIGVRAMDEAGNVQKNEAEGLFGNAYPNGTDAIHRLTIRGA